MIHRLNGEADPRLGNYRYVADGAWLAANGLFVAEGRLVVDRLIGAPGHEVESVVVTPAALPALEPALSDAACDVYVVDRRILRAITGFNFHRGCLALARCPAAVDPAALLGVRWLLVLEGVGNPDNVGGLFRTAAALGAGGVLLDPSTGDPLYRKAIRTSMAATLRLPWARLERWPDALALLRQAGFLVVALTPAKSARPLGEVASAIGPGRRLALLVGSEGSGLSAGALELADVRARIPMEPAVDSLNVTVAAGIAMDRLARV